MKDVIHMGGGGGFWGDALDPASDMLKGTQQLDYLAFDFLAELTMALLQRQKLKTPDLGFVPDAVTYADALMKDAREKGTRLISNGGGANPKAAGQRIAEAAARQGLGGTKIGVVEGDDILSRLDDFMAQGVSFANFETGEDNFKALRNRVVSANVYTDSTGIVESLGSGADIVVTGRVSDNALFVGPIIHEFGWKHDAAHADKIGAAITVGHVVECAAGCTGGMSSRWAEMPHMGRVGFPTIEFHQNGEAVISKIAGSGGRVDEFTIKEHLLYEIGDPRRYTMPDGVADFTAVRVKQEGSDRVRLSGMRGTPQPDTFKVVIGYHDGWIGEGMLFFPWPDALGRAQKAKDTLLERFERLGLISEAVHFDFVGGDMLHGPAAPKLTYEPNEIGLRVAVKTRDREEAEKVRRACAQLWIMGPGGTAFGTPMKPRPVIAAWPALVPKELVKQSVEILVA